MIIYIKCRKSAKVRVKNVHFLNVRVKKYSRSQDSYVLQCILLKTFVRLMFAVLAIRELFFNCELLSIYGACRKWLITNTRLEVCVCK